MKKYIALILAALLALSTLIGCTNTPAGQDTTTAKAEETTKAAETEKEETTKAAETEKAEDDTTEAATEAEPSGEIPTIRLSYACIVITPSPESVDLVEENINKYLDEIDLGVHVDLDLLDGTNYSTIIDNAALAGEDLDIIMLQDLPAAVNSNKLLPLDPYLDNDLAGTVETIGIDSFAGCTFGGKVMSVPRYCTDVLTYYWVCDYEAQKPVLGLEEGTEFTIDELDEALLKLKEAYPDMITMGVFPASTNNVNSYQLSAVYGGKQYDNVTDLGSGAAIIGLDNYNVVNYYESDTFKKICEEGRKWYNEGLVNDDPSVESEHAYDLIKADRCLSYIIGYSGYNAQVTKAEEDNTHLKS
ncbi:MAG: extracellular solute-binding protein, partial [Lachnospiraceae bacterium]|nr:extracellular solute-binding protein [Lachnospiraceae bacterium]